MESKSYGHGVIWSVRNWTYYRGFWDTRVLREGTWDVSRMSLNVWSPDIGILWRRLEKWDLNKLTWGLGFCFCLVECILCRTSLLAFRKGECEEEKNVKILKEKRGKEGKVASKGCDYVGREEREFYGLKLLGIFYVLHHISFLFRGNTVSFLRNKWIQNIAVWVPRITLAP